jgi:hypothetical protein
MAWCIFNPCDAIQGYFYLDLKDGHAAAVRYNHVYNCFFQEVGSANIICTQ